MCPGDVLDIEADQFGAAQGTSKADQKQCLIADASHIVGADRQESLDLRRGEGGRAPRRLPMRSRDAAQRLPDGRVSRVQWLLDDPVCPRDGGDPAAQRGQRVTSSSIGEIGADDFGRGRHRFKPPLPAPGLEIGQIGLIGQQRRRSVGCRLVDLRPGQRSGCRQRQRPRVVGAPDGNGGFRQSERLGGGDHVPRHGGSWSTHRPHVNTREGRLSRVDGRILDSPPSAR